MNPFFAGVFTPGISPGHIESLTDAAVKCTFVLIVALTVLIVAGRQSPAWRGWVLTLALISLPAVFAVSFVFPEWRWKEVLSLRQPEVFSTPAPDKGAPLIVNVQPLTGTASPASDAPIEMGFPSLSNAIFLTWVAGSSLTAILLLTRQALAMKRRRSFIQVRRGVLVEHLEEECRRAGLKGRPALLVAGEWVMPSTWGILNPAILLPREASEWPARKLRHVLWHEMAHIARNDVLTSLLSAPASVLLWFNPLLWLARYQLRHLRESACDDWVLTQGNAEATAYSADLLAIVRHHSQQVLPVGGMAMARSSKVGSRVHRLLSSTVRRDAMPLRSRITLTAAWCVMASLTTLLISCRTPVSASPASQPDAIYSFSVSGLAKSGGEEITYSVLEVSYDRTKIPTWLQPAEQSPFHALAYSSLRQLSQKKGVDLLAFPTTLQGQRARLDSNSLKVELIGSGSGPEGTIKTKAVITRPEAADTAGPTTPATRKYDELRIPNGGFVLLPGTQRDLPPSSPPVGNSTSKRADNPRAAILGIAASSRSLPATPAAHDRKSVGMSPIPGDASLPKGKALYRITVHHIEKVEGSRWTTNWPPPLPRESDQQKAAQNLLNGLRRNPGIRITDFPPVTVIKGNRITLQTDSARPIETTKFNPFEIGSAETMFGSNSGIWIQLVPSSEDDKEHTLEVDWLSVTSLQTPPAGMQSGSSPGRQSNSGHTTETLNNGNSLAIIGTPFHNPTARNTALLLHVETFRNP